MRNNYRLLRIKLKGKKEDTTMYTFNFIVGNKYDWKFVSSETCTLEQASEYAERLVDDMCNTFASGTKAAIRACSISERKLIALNKRFPSIEVIKMVDM